jgi:hypothetical protein
MKSIIGLVTALAFAAALPAFADGKEEKVKLSDCPEAVQKTIKENANGGKIVEIEKETSKDGTVTYEAEVKKTDGTVKLKSLRMANSSRSRLKTMRMTRTATKMIRS